MMLKSEKFEIFIYVSDLLLQSDCMLNFFHFTPAIVIYYARFHIIYRLNFKLIKPYCNVIDQQMDINDKQLWVLWIFTIKNRWINQNVTVKLICLLTPLPRRQQRSQRDYTQNMFILIRAYIQSLIIIFCSKTMFTHINGNYLLFQMWFRIVYWAISYIDIPFTKHLADARNKYFRY